MERLARNMGEATRHCPWYVTESSSDPVAGVALGIYSREPFRSQLLGLAFDSLPTMNATCAPI